MTKKFAEVTKQQQQEMQFLPQQSAGDIDKMEKEDQTKEWYRTTNKLKQYDDNCNSILKRSNATQLNN